MKCNTVIQVVTVGITVALVVLFCFLAQFGAIVGGASLTAFYESTHDTLLTPSSILGYTIWARAAITIVFSIAIFMGPHRDVGKIPDRIAIFAAIGNLLCASWILFASYAGGDYPEQAWVSFLALTLLWITEAIVVERADLGMRWRQGPLVMLYRAATGHNIFADDGNRSVEAGRAGGARRNTYKRVGRNGNRDDDADGSCGNVIDFSSQNATDLRASYGNGARAVHFFMIEFPMGTMFGALSVLVIATMAQMIDYYAAPSGDVTMATSVLLEVLALFVALIYSIGKGLHSYAIGTIVITAYQLHKQYSVAAPIVPLINTSIASIVILAGAVLMISGVRIYHYIRKTHV